MNANAMTLGLPTARYGLDTPLCLALATLIGWGLVMVASASVAIGQKVAGSPLYFFERQLLFTVFAGALALAIFAVPLRSWQRSGFTLLVLALVLLTLVLIPGVGERLNSSRRWLHLGPFNLQASEPARLAMVVYLAGYIVRRQVRLQESVVGLAVACVPLGLAGVLMLAEPDFGAAVILFTVAIVMLFVGGARLRDLLLAGVVVGLGMALLALTASYRVRRLLSFVDPWAHAQDAGFQLVQSLIAVGRGQVFGVGLGNSVQKLLYLPEMHTDFIFAILAEEFGLIGIVCLVGLYAVIVWRGFVIGRRAELRGALFESYLTYGLSAWIGLQALLNMAVNMGLLPTKGLTLPLVSYGGSSLITVYAMLALILRVDHENRSTAAAHPGYGGRP